MTVLHSLRRARRDCRPPHVVTSRDRARTAGARLLDEQLRKASARATESIVRRFGDRLGMWVGCGYPKSGTVWLCQLLSSYLELPYPRQYRSPVAMASVIHAHWMPSTDTPRTVYVVRDGRDVMLSLYFYEARLATGGRNPAAARKRLARFRYVLGPSPDLKDVTGNLPRFIESQLADPSWVRAPWPQHVEAWLDASPDRVAVVRYEDMLGSVPDTLRPALESLTEEAVDMDALRLVSQRFSFERQVHRGPLSAQSRGFLRRGVAGEWRDYFSDEARIIFEQAAGSTLKRVGYDSHG